MRIQHNIMAMNAYRNYNTNTSALSKNLEKLSSGYKINRAGDDAAGLAISEKMRAQITGLDAAQKNVKDGISLVKTAEGAMQEIQDMLNRMDYLATQSANGTYQDAVDRENLQKEVENLKTEINRIADSANFNGIKLLDGSLDPDARQATTKTIFSNLTMADNVNDKVHNAAAAINDSKKPGSSSDSGGLELTGVTASNGVIYHEDAAGAGKTSFVIDLDGANFSSASAGTALTDLIFGLDSGTTPADAPTVTPKNNCLFLTKAKTGSDNTDDVLKYSVTAGDNGITSEMLATAIQDVIDKNDGKVYIEPAAGGNRIEYTVTRDGDKLTFTMTDDGYNTAKDLQTTAATSNNNYFQGNFNFAVDYKAATTAGLSDTEKTFINDVMGNQQHIASSVINQGGPSTGTVYAEATIRFSDSAGTATANNADGLNNTSAIFKDGAGIQIGDEYYVFARSKEVLGIEYADNVKVVDLTDLENLGDTTNGSADLLKALDRLSVAAKDNEMFNVQVSKNNTSLVIKERTTYTGDANLTKFDRGLENQIRTFDSAVSTTTVDKEAGTELTLQIGDTADDFNQMKVKVGDMHTKAMKIADIDISTQKGAADAVQTIKDAINYVSSIRGDLGAVQNRLEHTGNNLSVMAENIQDAESTIRDTDVANEMMSYVKNNILVQSAQAMLAQANQVPQGVLQLLG